MAIIKKIGLVAVSVVALVLSLGSSIVVSAQDYANDYPSYVPVSGGAYAEVQTTVYGRMTLLFQYEDKVNSMGFTGTGYNLYNLSNHTVSIHAYLQNPRNFSGVTVSELTGSFSTFGQLSLRIPTGYTTGGSIQYTSVSVPTTAIYNTNMNFLDQAGDRVNDHLRYTFSDNMLVILCGLFALFGVSMVAQKIWCA